MTELEWFQCANPHLMLAHLTRKSGPSRLPWLSWLGVRGDVGSSRRSLLFAIACCRRVEHLLVDSRSRYALEVVEKLAEGQAGRKERALAETAAAAAAFDASSPRVGVGGWLASAQARAAEAVAALVTEANPANVAAARAKEAVRAQAKARLIPKVGIPGLPASTEISWSSTVIVPGASASPAVPSEEAVWSEEATIQCAYLRDIFGNPYQPLKIDRRAVQDPQAIELARRIYDERAFTRLPEIANILSSHGIDHPALLSHCRQPSPHVRGCWAIDLLRGVS